MEYTILKPVDNPPVSRRRGHAKHEKLYALLSSVTDHKWIPVKCKTAEQARTLSNAVRGYFRRGGRKTEFRYEDVILYIKLVRD